MREHKTELVADLRDLAPRIPHIQDALTKAAAQSDGCRTEEALQRAFEGIQNTFSQNIGGVLDVKGIGFAGESGPGVLVVDDITLSFGPTPLLNRREEITAKNSGIIENVLNFCNALRSENIKMILHEAGVTELDFSGTGKYRIEGHKAFLRFDAFFIQYPIRNESNAAAVLEEMLGYAQEEVGLIPGRD